MLAAPAYALALATHQQALDGAETRTQQTHAKNAYAACLAHAQAAHPTTDFTHPSNPMSQYPRKSATKLPARAARPAPAPIPASRNLSRLPLYTTEASDVARGRQEWPPVAAPVARAARPYSDAVRAVGGLTTRQQQDYK